MGQKHAKCLRKLGEAVEMVDIEFKPNKLTWRKLRPKSVIIAAPAYTHVNLINKIPSNIPVFCEKPLLIDVFQRIKPRKSPTLMACNWTFCECIKKAQRLTLYYPSNDAYKYLDYMHFVLLPKLKVKIFFSGIARLSWIDDMQEIHKVDCGMFLDQMKHWLRVINYKENSRLSFEKAIEYNKQLIRDESYRQHISLHVEIIKNFPQA